MLANHRTAVDEHGCGKVDNRGRKVWKNIGRLAVNSACVWATHTTWRPGLRSASLNGKKPASWFFSSLAPRPASPDHRKAPKPRTRRRLPGRQYARHQESRHTKIIYAGDSQLTALFAESGQTMKLSKYAGYPRPRTGSSIPASEKISCSRTSVSATQFR